MMISDAEREKRAVLEWQRMWNRDPAHVYETMCCAIEWFDWCLYWGLEP